MAFTLKFIDLFAGMGGFRLGFETACSKLAITPRCVFSSEIKPHAIQVYQDNFQDSQLMGDITQVKVEAIPDFDVLLAGFPCQAFSYAGKRQGFLDTRGTLFFEIERILKAKLPPVFILENVEGLVSHDKKDNNELIGRTLQTILEKLQQLNYQVSWKVLDAKHFGLAQTRKRIFIVGCQSSLISLENFPIQQVQLKAILEKQKTVMNTPLSRLLLSHYSLNELCGKSIKDKRGGENNIHSWDIGLKGEVNSEQKQLLEAILLARRNKKWATQKGITWMDGMPLTLKEIASFYSHPNLKMLLDDLVSKNYLKFEYPKDLHKTMENKTTRQYREDLEKGYNIVAGKLSYEISKILDPECVTPTLVATDLDRVVVPDTTGIRKLTLIEQCRLFGFPDHFKINVSERLAHDLFGNTVPVPVVCAISERVIEQVFLKKTVNHAQEKQRAQVLPLQYNLLM